MSLQDIGIIAGIVVTLCITLGPWMFMVHAKLAVLVTQVNGLTGQFERFSAAERERAPQCTEHRLRLEEIDRRLTELEKK